MVAAKLPGSSGADLLAEASLQARQAAAQAPGTMLAAHALADEADTKKVRACTRLCSC